VILGPFFTCANIFEVENPYKDDFEKFARAIVKLEYKLSVLHHFLDILVFLWDPEICAKSTTKLDVFVCPQL
jgi:hypothetical protein